MHRMALELTHYPSVLVHFLTPLLTWIYTGMSIHPLNKLLRFQDERNQQIVERYEAGEPRASIAADYGLTVRWVGYIIQRAKGNRG